MKAFDRIRSGFPELDGVLDNIRLGDNVVWQVSNLEEYKLFARAFARQCIEEKLNLIYVRFSGSPSMCTASSNRRDGRRFMSLTACRSWRKPGLRT